MAKSAQWFGVKHIAQNSSGVLTDPVVQIVPDDHALNVSDPGFGGLVQLWLRSPYDDYYMRGVIVRNNTQRQ